MPDLFALLEPSLSPDFDAGTLERARLLLARQAVSGLRVELDDERAEAQALVRGSEPWPYRVRAWVTRHADDVVSVATSCSCPVGEQCKHGAAVVLAALDERHRLQRPAWQSSLELVLDELDRRPRPVAAPAPLALQLDLLGPSLGTEWRVHSGPVVLLRPMRRGAKGTSWVKSGVSWRRLLSGADDDTFLREHVELLTQLHASATGPRTTHGSEQLALADLGARVWPLLRRAREVGLELLPAGALREVQVLDERVEAAVDLRAVDGATGAATEVVLGVEAQGRWWGGDDVVAVGQPAHGVLLLAPAPGALPVDGTPRPGRPRAAVLAALARPLPPAALRLAARPLVVPREATGQLEREYLPRLVRQVRLGSSDASVQVPAVLAPRLLLSVTWRAADHAALEWRWAYGEGDARLTCGLRDRHALRGVRDEEAERKALAEVVASGHVDPLLQTSTRLPETSQVTGAAAVTLARWVLPALREGGLVEVTESEPPQFREALGVPEVRFDVVVPEAGSGPGGSGERRGEATDWLDLAVAVEIDGERVPLVAVLEALTLGDELIVLPSGLFFPTDHPALARLRELVAAAAEIHGTETDDERPLRVAREDVDTWGLLAATGALDAQALAWSERIAALRDLEALPVRPVPAGVAATLRGYQLEGFGWLGFLREQGLGGVLADDMGLGKTVQVLAAICEAREAGSDPFLVVAPTSVVTSWVGEAARHTPGLRVVAVTSSLRRRGGAALAELVDGADVVVTSYTLLRLDQDLWAARRWGGLVLDEAQQVKNHRSQGHAAARRIEAPFRLAVTGTPFENRLMELWSLLAITNPGLYPTPARFSQSVVKPVESGDEQALARLRRRLRPFLLRRTKEVVAADLPPKQEQVLEVQLAPKHRRAYDVHLQRERQRILGLLDDFDENRVAVFAAITRLRRLALHAGLVDDELREVPSAKLDLLVEHVRELAAEGHRALVFSQFTSFLAVVRERLEAEGIAVSYLDGATRDRPAVVEGFRRGEQPVFLISLKAGGVGLTLTEADYVFVLDPWWNPAVESQAVDRAHRIGQTRPVIVYRLVALDTVEEKVMALKEHKARLFADVVDGGGGFGSAVTADDLRALLAD